jgi:hypothetical protein
MVCRNPVKRYSTTIETNDVRMLFGQSPDHQGKQRYTYTLRTVIPTAKESNDLLTLSEPSSRPPSDHAYEVRSVREGSPDVGTVQITKETSTVDSCDSRVADWAVYQ